MSLVPSSKKVTVGVLGILLGALGVHKFAMGFRRAGMTMLGTTVVCWLLGHFLFLFSLIGWGVGVLGFIEGIIYLTKNDTDWYRDYVINKQEWF